jgi:hypothetical protein
MYVARLARGSCRSEERRDCPFAAMRQSALGIVLLYFLATQAGLAQSGDPFRSEAPPPPQPAPHTQAPTPEPVAPPPAALEPIPSNAILVEAAMSKKVNQEESWNKNCLNNTLPIISIVEQPKHGALSIRQEQVRIPDASPRCGGKYVIGNAMYYQSAVGFKGYDRIIFDVVYPNGVSRRKSIDLAVQ